MGPIPDQCIQIDRGIVSQSVQSLYYEVYFVIRWKIFETLAYWNFNIPYTLLRPNYLPSISEGLDQFEYLILVVHYSFSKIDRTPLPPFGRGYGNGIELTFSSIGGTGFPNFRRDVSPRVVDNFRVYLHGPDSRASE